LRLVREPGLHRNAVRPYSCTAKVRNIQVFVEYWILYLLCNASLSFYSPTSKWNCGIVSSLREVGSRGGSPNRLGSASTWRSQVCSGSAWFRLRCGFAAQAGEEIARGLASWIAIAACAENIFDALKSQAGRGGLVTPDLACCRLAALLSALFYAWWSILRSSGRAGPAYGGHHQPATALACHRHAGAACETNNDHRSAFTGEGGSGREGVSRCRHFSPRSAKNAAPLTDLQRWRLSAREPFKFSFKGRHLQGPSLARAVTCKGRHLRSPPRHAPGFLNFR
jgi:hypothetical protein